MTTKTCSKCNQDKDIDLFPPRKGGRYGTHSWCQDCFREYKKKYWEKNRDLLSAKRKASYEADPGRYKKQMKEYYHKSDKVEWAYKSWSSKLQREYGMTVEQYEIMLSEQGGLCKICGREETHRHFGKPVRMAVDHCHETGVVRGLLCRNCNVAIGLLGHSVSRLEKAICYLQDFSILNSKVQVDHPEGSLISP
jgi:hypothetical protein